MSRHSHLHTAGTRWGNLREPTRWEDKTPPAKDPARTADLQGRNVRNAATGYTLFHQSVMPVGRYRSRTMERVPAVLLLYLASFAENRIHARFAPVVDYVDRHRQEIERRADAEDHRLDWFLDFESKS